MDRPVSTSAPIVEQDCDECCRMQGDPISDRQGRFLLLFAHQHAPLSRGTTILCERHKDRATTELMRDHRWFKVMLLTEIEGSPTPKTDKYPIPGKPDFPQPKPHG